MASNERFYIQSFNIFKVSTINGHGGHPGNVTWTQVVLGQAYRGLTGGFLLLRIFSVGISVSPHVCFILDLILISMFLR